MNDAKSGAQMAAIRAAALEDILQATDADLRREAQDDGEDIAAVAARGKAAMRETAAAAVRQRMVQAKARMRAAPGNAAHSRPRPSLGHIKRVTQQAFARDAGLGLAFRDGKHQSDADWQSLYDDLVALGAIDPDRDAP